MLKQACLFGLLAATTVVSLALWRADSGKNGQTSGQEAAAVGANTARQSSNQFIYSMFSTTFFTVVAAQSTWPLTE